MPPQTRSSARVQRQIRTCAAISHKALKRHDPNKPSLAKLSQELLNMITEHLHAVDPQSIVSLALVCSAFYRAARDVQHRDITLDYGDCGAAVDRMNRIVGSGLLPSIRTLRVWPPYHLEQTLTTCHSRTSSTWRRQADVAAWDQLCDLVPRIPGLCDLHWNSAVIPDGVVAHLAQTPRVRLHLSLIPSPNCSRDTFLRELPSRLASTAGISSFSLAFGYHDISVPEMQLWADRLDWSRLRRLCLGGAPTALAAYLAPRLTALEHLEFTDPDAHETHRLAIPALQTIPARLKSLALPRLPPGFPSLVPFLTPHIRTLRRFSMGSEMPPDVLLLFQTARRGSTG